MMGRPFCAARLATDAETYRHSAYEGRALIDAFRARRGEGVDGRLGAHKTKENGG